MTKRRAKRASSDDSQIIGLFSVLCCFIVGYFATETLLVAYTHLLHWLTAFVAGGAAYFAVLGWYHLQRPRGSN